MDPCPHCGEPIADDATRCPHCGSDSETGWNAEVDYYSLELPDSDDETEPRSAPPAHDLRDASGGAAQRIGLAVLTLSLVLFALVGFQRYEWGVLVLLACVGVAALGSQRVRSRARNGR